MDDAVKQALEHTFNSDEVAGLSDKQYKEYIQSCAVLTLSTMIQSEGRRFVKDFCQAALNETGPTPVVKQAKRKSNSDFH